MARYYARRNEWVLAAAIMLLTFASGAFVGYLIANPASPTGLTVAPTLQPLPEEKSLFASARVLAVRGDTMQGVVSHVSVEISKGRGRVLVNTNPFVEPDTQQSAETAVRVAQNRTGIALGDRDVIITFGNESNLVGGPSAGGAMTVVLMSALSGNFVNRSVAMTGTIEPDGGIGFVGGVLEKAEAAAKDGVTLFLVPKGEEILTYYEQHVEQQEVAPGFYVQQVYYVPKQVDLDNYTKTNWNMTVRGVRNIEEAAAAMLA
ncbi:hypothetical protein COT29_04060 [Candidatus Micrarchaeota archaeon CG08_land_8_20_14_0_20_59_11]|nr:MAG: hypothetical protein COT29_04060 [Candidatus Micrarchaeota archaeon CG08_land_8_20_14_0_20_59_11]